MSQQSLEAILCDFKKIENLIERIQVILAKAHYNNKTDLKPVAVMAELILNIIKSNENLSPIFDYKMNETYTLGFGLFLIPRLIRNQIQKEKETPIDVKIMKIECMIELVYHNLNEIQEKFYEMNEKIVVVDSVEELAELLEKL